MSDKQVQRNFEPRSRRFKRERKQKRKQIYGLLVMFIMAFVFTAGIWIALPILKAGAYALLDAPIEQMTKNAQEDNTDSKASSANNESDSESEQNNINITEKENSGSSAEEGTQSKENANKEENEQDAHAQKTSNNNSDFTENAQNDASQKTNKTEKVTAGYVLSHKVQRHETLFSIAMHYYATESYQDILASYNHITNPGKQIQAGMTLDIPDPKYMIYHTVKRGESLLTICNTYYDTSAYCGALARHNSISDPNHLELGTRLFIPSPILMDKDVQLPKEEESEVPTSNEPEANDTYNVTINKAKNELTVSKGNKVIKTFPVGTGKEKSTTPEGTFKIANKLENPWYREGGIAGGDPANPLGSNWLGLDVPGTDGTLYGIHGTNNPDSIGTHVSQGCVRMHNKDIEWLYDYLPMYTTVKIISGE
ncbi:L,D-transpeptidase family protein [Lentibacillus saliphilus]|uniref:L,D-transpeptidase family protein n=1 Tax=Lentibacillus saliphilus TaxID=2737028 RepID=UPI001C2F8F3A|nr:L,D-transpeptidase family protein [Lentibacillus saliphilus]